jgi:AT-binding transcription factor 1
MAQLQGMNPLVAMNLHPPLIPPSMMASANMDPVASAFLSQIQAAQEQQQQNANAQNNVLSKLGIDAKMIGQSGLDPKLLLQLGQMDPKLLPQLGNDPALASLLGQSPKDKNQGLCPKSFFQMLQMGLPPSPDPKLLSQLAQMRGDKGTTVAQQQPPPPPPPPPPYHLDKKFPFSGGFPPFDQGNFAHSPTGQDPKSILMQQKQMFQHPEQAKRARTRITDDQLKVLRSNFDINNSPAENQIHSMSQQTGLPPKVIKHWFRNTLFKERQRNKDSPYNFNNPPSTLLNLEEYEKTGESKVLPLKAEDHDRDRGVDSDDGKPDNDRDSKEDLEVTEYIAEGSTASASEIRLRNEEELFKVNPNANRPTLATTPLAVANICNSIGSPVPTMSSLSQHLHTSSVSTPTTPVSERSSPCSTNLTLSSILSSQMNHMGKGSPGFLPPHLVPSFTGLGGGRLPDFLNPLANMMGSQDPQQSNRQVLMHSPTPQSQGQSSQGKRANRTRFTDYQIKVLQEFFENNAYPKDDDLEYLSKLLNLSPRVIVVWFQNARQKARKIYENQPPLDPNDEGAGRFTRTPGLNYQCKKCLLVFQRYYELIRHQKQHCFKEEDAKRSAQAQKAAAQAAAQFSRQQSSGGIAAGAPSVSHTSDDSNSSTGLDRYVASPIFNQSGHEEFLKHRSEDWPSENHLRSEEHKKITPSMFDQMTREDAFSKMMNPIAGSYFPSSYPPSTPFGILQQQALPFSLRDRDRDSGDELDNESVSSSPSSKRKHSDDGMDTDDKEESGQPRDKRLRTTILPEQLDFLYQKYQIESNPSRKMLEQIASEVGLRKRVVQVWFQNTRARERKGQFRAHQQVINKRCPFCPAIFRVRSALESHLSSKHIDQYTRGEIDIDSLPDAEGFHEGSFSEHARSSSTPIPGSQAAFASAQAHGFSQKQELEQSMRKYYEDTMKRYMNDLQGNKSDLLGHQDDSTSASAAREGSHALDLSSPLPALMSNNLPTFDLNSQRGMADNDDDSSYWDKDDQSVCSESNEYDESASHHEDGLLRSPLSPSQGSSARHQDGSNMGNKRFRTQMSGIQIKLMKSVFQFYKTPTMSECASLGKDIGLQKRVVQVWFQNARAKEKKARLQLHQMTGKEPEQPPVPTECGICNYSYSTPTAIQDHLFERLHLENVKLAIEQGHYEPQAPGEVLNQAIATIQAGLDNRKSQSSPLSSAIGSSPSNPSNPSNNSHLQILQMAAQGIRLPNSSDTSEANSSFASSEDSEPRESMEKTLLHLYGMGRGLPPSFPSAVGPPNPFLHPAMFSATGKSN